MYILNHLIDQQINHTAKKKKTTKIILQLNNSMTCALFYIKSLHIQLVHTNKMNVLYNVLFSTA